MSENRRDDDWDPRNPTPPGDQRGAYDDMRERCPVAHSKLMGWSVFRHADITAAVADPLTFSNASRFLAIPNSMDPPVHGRYYQALAAILDAERVARFEPSVRALAVSLLGSVSAGRDLEFIAAFATPFALKAQCAFLGWPDAQWESLAGWVHGSQDAAFTQDPIAGKAQAELFAGLVKANVDRARTSPGDVDGAMAALLTLEVDGERFTDDDFPAVLRNWVAGHGTVAAGLGILVLHLAQDPEVQDRLRGNPSLIPAAIEEILRLDDPLVGNRRTVTRDVEIQGRTIPKGASVTLMWNAANRDPRAFADPGLIEVGRNTDAAFVWGHGLHLCLGAGLARMELRVALEELLARTKRIALADDPARRARYPSNGLDLLPLRVS